MTKAYLFTTVGLMIVTVSCMYRWFLRPVLAKLNPVLALQVLLAVHCFRFISPISLIPGVVLPGLSTSFTYPQVLGDVGTALLALIAISLLRSGSRVAIAWVWVTNVFGSLDLAVVAVQGLRFDFADHVGGMFYIVVWFVPWLLLSHLVIFSRLANPTSLALSR